MRLKALLLALIISVNLIALPAYANEVQSVQMSSYSADREFISMLGISDGIDMEDSNRVVTRAEFAALTVNMMNMSELSASDDGFDDIYLSSDYGKQVYGALALGIISPSANRLFNPDDPVSYEAAVKMVVAALGYNKYAIAKGGYPAGYLALASGLKILDGVDSNFTMSDAICLISNALRTDIWLFNSLIGDDIVYKSEAGRNLLTENFDLTHVSGVATTAGVYSVNFAYSSSENMLELSGRMYECKVENAEDYLGFQLDAWHNENNEIIALYPASSNNTVQLDASDVTDVIGNRIIYYDGNKERAYYLDAGYFFSMNGRYHNQTESDFKFENGTLTLVDNNSDNKYDFVIAKKTEFFLVSAIDELDSVLYDSKQTDKPIMLKKESDTYNKVRIYNYTKGTYIASDYESITVGSLLEVRRNSDESLIEIDIITSNVLSGTIDEKGDDTVVVAGKSYEIASHFVNTGGKISIGQYGEYLLSSSGRIVAKRDAIDTMKYGYFLNYKKSTSAFGAPKIKILTDANQVMAYDFGKKVTLNGNPVPSDHSDIEEALMSGGKPVYQLIKYSVNSKGEFSVIDTSASIPSDGRPIVGAEGNDTLVKYVDRQTAKYKTAGNLIVPFGKISATTVFYVPSALASTSGVEYDDEFFTCAGTSRLANDDEPVIDTYDYNENYIPAAVVVYSMLGGASSAVVPDATAPSYMVSKITEAVDFEGNVSKKLSLCNASGYKTYVIDYEICEELKETGKIPGRGDVVRISLDHKNEINGIARDAIYNAATGAITINYTDNVYTHAGERLTYASGKAVSVGDGALTLDILTIASTGVPAMLNNKLTYGFSATKAVVYPGARGDVRVINAGDIKSESNFGIGNSDLVLLRTSYWNAASVFVYRRN